MRRTVFNDDHEAFRETVRAFLTKEVVPQYAQWEQLGHPPREFYRRMGALGLLGIAVPEEFGGGGASGLRFSAVLSEETARHGVTLGASRVHSDLVLPYLLEYATPEQKQRWLPGFASGDLMTAIAMTEPGTGSDLAGITTTARRDGDVYVLNGSKTFITGGALADLVLVVCRTAPRQDGDRRAGLSILVVEATSPGFSVGRKLEKIGLRTQDTAELFFDEVRVPAANLLGEEGEAFGYLSHNLVQERLAIVIGAVTAAAAAVEMTVEYVRQREVFGKPLSSFQNTKFVLAECAAEVEAGQVLMDRAIEEHERGELSHADVAKAKLFCTEMEGRVIDKCLQLHGGYGYMLEYPIARLYADARVHRVYGGTSEVQKSIVGKSLGL
ncbi:acyl-CoA dehydrogenase [Wenjunlia vitaminophila]|uniref:Acyl-[acyl-carrier-protein] dehydrogenase MbtN n=1 Tax=Wenjunlia vitaminophila TaxID=76728 RepID=A3R4S5_WENVI|nr:acyl-CoA dehydrogenase family protein [Wenjunlia vitaminophila]ABO15870.1 acyl-CoA dehydrogenase [Wenjunlia vitaminophila]KRV49617.1 acyl-CoA dehydrogenase [Wenjunlia vitaminophila]